MRPVKGEELFQKNSMRGSTAGHIGSDEGGTETSSTTESTKKERKKILAEGLRIRPGKRKPQMAKSKLTREVS